MTQGIHANITTMAVAAGFVVLWFSTLAGMFVAG